MRSASDSRNPSTCHVDTFAFHIIFSGSSMAPLIVSFSGKGGNLSRFFSAVFVRCPRIMGTRNDSVDLIERRTGLQLLVSDVRILQIHQDGNVLLLNFKAPSEQP